MRATTAMVERQLEVVRQVTGRKNLRCVFDRKEGGWRIEDIYPDGRYNTVFGFGRGHDTNSFYHLLLGFASGVTTAKEGRA